jgi:hypothetical protein
MDASRRADGLPEATMLATRIFNRGLLFSTLSEERWPEVKQGTREGVERAYILDLAGITGEQQLFNGLLTAFELIGPEETIKTSHDGCLDYLRGALVLRPESDVLLAVFNSGELQAHSFELFLNFLCLLCGVERDILAVVPSGSRHRVCLKVVFFGEGDNYPEIPDWGRRTHNPERE